MSELIQLSNIGNIISNIGNTLIENQNLLKLIKYNSSNALLQPDLTIEEIIDLCGFGSDPLNQQRIFKYPFFNNIVDSVRSELRFFIPKIKPENIYLSEVFINFQIIIHNSIIDLDNNKQRTFKIIEEILKTFNREDINGIGNLMLKNSIDIVAWNNSFSGYTFNMLTRFT